ncbi:MAG: KH domain-containing protein, partial [Candidatus Altiarchaeota archaeon]|nr:KH domain-containing protein [Candidatus Altiarchaeota archaeon]
MNKIRLSSDEIKLINMVESMTGAKVNDCVQDGDVMGFVVEKGDVGLAVGKKVCNIERLRKVLGKNIMVFEYSADSDEFI